MSSQQALADEIQKRFDTNPELVELIVSCGSVTPSGEADQNRRSHAVVASKCGMVGKAIVGQPLIKMIKDAAQEMNQNIDKAAIALYAGRRGENDQVTCYIAINRVGRMNEQSYKINGAGPDSSDIQIYDYPQNIAAVINVATGQVIKDRSDSDRAKNNAVPVKAIEGMTVMARNRLLEITNIKTPCTDTIRRYGRGGR